MYWRAVTQHKELLHIYIQGAPKNSNPLGKILYL